MVEADVMYLGEFDSLERVVLVYGEYERRGVENERMRRKLEALEFAGLEVEVGCEDDVRAGRWAA